MVDRGSETVEVVLGSWGLTWHGWWQVECGCACSALSANMHDDGDPGTLLLRVRARRLPNSVLRRQQIRQEGEKEGTRGNGFLVCEREGGETEKKASKHT